MGYDIYHKKWYIETSDGRICPIVLYSDSRTYEPGTRKHPRWFAINNPFGGLLVDKEKYNKKREEQIAEEMSFDKNATLSSPTFYGNRYPGGNTYKAKISFLIAKKTIPANEFFAEHDLIINCYEYDEYSHVKEFISSVIKNEDDLQKANEKYCLMLNQGKRISLGVCICGQDVYKYI